MTGKKEIILSQFSESDDEAYEADGDLKKKQRLSSNMYKNPTDIIKNIDDINEHIATDGNADDNSSEIRKNAKKRAVALKKLAAEAKKYA